MDKHYSSGEKLHSYTIINLIAQGRYGIIYLCNDENGNKFILKQLKKDELKQSENKLFYEVELLSGLNDSRFPKFIEKFYEDDNIIYVLEYIQGKVYEDLLREGYRFTRKEIYAIADQLLSIIYILQQNNIVHRDIRPPNVIIKPNRQLVLIDFGLARYIDNERYIKEIDYWYLADFLIHLYYSTYDVESDSDDDKPWFEELDLSDLEINFLKKLMGIDGKFNNIQEIRNALNLIKN